MSTFSVRKKPGANFQDRNLITQLSSQGMSAEEISDQLLIDLKAVLAFGDFSVPEVEEVAEEAEEDSD